MYVSTATAAVPGRQNEDFVGRTGQVLVLIDGAGNPPRSATGCLHGVAWYARNLGATLLRTAQAPIRLTHALAAAIEQVAASHSATCDLRHPGSPSATVIVTRLDDGYLDYLVLADSTLLLGTTTGGAFTITDNREALVGAPYRSRLDQLPCGTAEHANALTAYVESMRAHRNQPGDNGFWVASADPAAADEAITGRLPVAELAAFAALSDGAARLVDRFQLATWDEVLRILATVGPTELIDRVRAAEHSDPNGRRWPRGKPHDDATAPDRQARALAHPTWWGGH
ncbi:protein phosphatase 2C domain-containing protein [Nocardia transvalensis]|uniref:protein phosphatase 2C domain-containing protein n=1 Tax=Nocardia transvalensis TaxID=37333 RepID=UPI003A5CEE8D